MKASAGRLMHSSVTSGLARSGRSARNVRSSADESLDAYRGSRPTGARGPGLAGDGAELINRPEIDVARDQNLDPVAVMLDDGGRDVDGAFQDFGQDLLGR